MTLAALTPIAAPTTYAPGARARIAGRVISGLALAFLVFDVGVKLLQAAPAVEATVALGFDASAVPVVGCVELLCLVAYLVPRTSVLGAVLFTGYLGGAIAIHLRVGSPLLSHTLFPLYVGAMIWGGLWLRHPGLRRLLAETSTGASSNL